LDTVQSAVCESDHVLVGGKTLEEQFSTARHLVKFIRPHWSVLVSDAGFVLTQQR